MQTLAHYIYRAENHLFAEDSRRRAVGHNFRISFVASFGSALENVTLNAGSDYAVKNVIIIISRNKLSVVILDRWSADRSIAAASSNAVRVGTCMALSEPPQTIDRDNSIAGASDASSSGFYIQGRA